MRLLTATSTGQGEREGDVTWTVEGELVGIDEPCARDADDPDGGCGCGRAFFGLSSHRSTTTALVRDVPLTAEDLVHALIGYYESAGYGTFSAAEVAPEVAELIAIGAAWPTGAVVERRLDLLRLRPALR